jgi:hypothetical protein
MGCPYCLRHRHMGGSKPGFIVFRHCLLPQKLLPSFPFLNKKPYLCAAKKSLTTYGFEGNAALNLAVYESLTHHITPSAQAVFYGEFAAQSAVFVQFRVKVQECDATEDVYRFKGPAHHNNKT